MVVRLDLFSQRGIVEYEVLAPVAPLRDELPTDPHEAVGTDLTLKQRTTKCRIEIKQQPGVKTRKAKIVKFGI